jgi:hypothetical protein
LNMQEHIEVLEAARSRVYRERWEANGAAVPKLKADAEEIDRHFQAASELAKNSVRIMSG